MKRHVESTKLEVNCLFCTVIFRGEERRFRISLHELQFHKHLVLFVIVNKVEEFPVDVKGSEHRHADSNSSQLKNTFKTEKKK